MFNKIKSRTELAKMNMITKKCSVIICILLIFNVASYAQQKPFMDYLLRWDGQSSTVAIELKYEVGTVDSTVFIFGDPSFGGQKDIFSVVKNIRVNKPEVLKIDNSKRQITIYHNGAKRHKIYYDIDGSFNIDKPTTTSQTELFRPVVTKGILTLVNKQFALDVTNESNPLVSFSWHNIPKHFTYFNSIEPSQKNPKNKLTAYFNNLSQKIYFVVGDHIEVKEYNVMEVTYYSVTTTLDKYGNKLQDDLRPFFDSYIPSIHRFWNDTDFPFYFLVVTALQNNYKEIGAGGFGIKNGFVMKLGRKFGEREKYVTAHETAHSWIGIKMMLGEDSFDHQWFGEGFNDYTTIINLANSKIFGKEDFLAYLNDETLRLHYQSKIKGVHNDSIAAKYWTDYANYGVLPYKRGLIYAFYLDNQIRLASNGKFTLRNMLLDLFQLRKDKLADEILTVEDFVNVSSRYLDRTEVEEQVKRHMIEGEPIDFSKIKLIPEFTIEINNDIPKVNLSAQADLSQIYQW